MRVFVTGATGFVGTAVVEELLSAGHTVVGLSRTETGDAKLKSQGAAPVRGTIEDLDLLQTTAAQCDAVVHLAFAANVADMAGSCAKDRAAITALGDALVASGSSSSSSTATRMRALVVTSGTALVSQGRGHPGDEDDTPLASHPMAALRGPSEGVCLAYAPRGLRACVVRLPPTTHGAGTSGLLGPLVRTAAHTGVSAYVGDGANLWCAGHRADAAVLYRLVLEQAAPGSVWHAAGEDGVPVRAIATALGRQMGLPVVSIPAEQAAAQFGWLAFAVHGDIPGTSAKTQARLGWTPTHPTLLADLPVVLAALNAATA